MSRSARVSSRRTQDDRINQKDHSIAQQNHANCRIVGENVAAAHGKSFFRLARGVETEDKQRSEDEENDLQAAQDGHEESHL